MRLVSNYTGALLVAGHGMCVFAWLLFMPGGFPFDHPRFWVNRALPALFLAFCICVCVKTWKGDRKYFRSLLLLIGTFWLAVAATSVFAFPRGRIKAVPCAAIPGILVWLAIFSPSSSKVTLARPALVAAVAAGVVCGLSVTLAQLAPASSTLPLNEQLPLPHVASNNPQPHPHAGFTVSESTGDLALQRGRYIISIAPLLTFTSRSPDRGWTNMVTARDREGPERRLLNSVALPDSGTWAEYGDDDRSVLQVQPRDDGIDLCTWSRLPHDIFSHLNTFTHIT
ncbi:MAG TPA: hypothetical protein VHM90_05860, partial [Phycisphaerae bacterium]|nr:hypothetical protein [Phycisphaerae bacterium]